MKNGHTLTLAAISMCFMLIAGRSYSQETGSEDLLREKAVKVYLNLGGRGFRGYTDYIKDEIPFVNYVRDRKQAHVYIMLTTERTGSGGTEYTITLFGQKNFNGINDTLRYASKPSEAYEITRAGVVNKLKIGLMRYIGNTPLSDYISISYKKESKPTEVVDKWNFWVFNIDFGTDLGGQKSRKDVEFNGNLSADRVTPELKLSFGVYSNFETNKFDLGDTTIVSTRKRSNFRALAVKSISQHWSVGGFGGVSSDTRFNNKLTIDIAPALEFNVFPYSECTRREFRFLYRAGYNYVDYYDKTIYYKTHENLFYESLAAIFELRERWGSWTASLTGKHYLHDFKKNHLTFSNYLRIYLFEGFSIRISGRASMIHDQLYLPMGGASTEDILLRRKEIATNYDFRFEFGINYQFGSIYSNVVNPRFGNSGRWH